MHKGRKKRQALLIILAIILCIMAIGYSVFNNSLTINGTSNITGSWNVSITDIDEYESSGAIDSQDSPSFDNINGLTATFSTILTYPGDYMTYKIKIENLGNLKAEISNIEINSDSSNDITFYLNKDKDGERISDNDRLIEEDDILNPNGDDLDEGYVYVTVKYNSYEGQVSPDDDERIVTTTLKVDFVQSNNSALYKHKYLVSYDCMTNGGENCKSNNEYLYPESSVNLEKVGTKKGYIFVGWNTNSSASNGLTDYTMSSNNITLYALFKEDKMNLSMSTVSTTHSITVTVNALADSGIKKIEYSLDGENWYEQIDSEISSNIYTFDNLTNDTEYNVKVRLTSNTGGTRLVEGNVETGHISIPTFTEAESGKRVTVTAIYPNECDSEYTCSYQKDGGHDISVGSGETEVTFDTDGVLLTKVTLANNTVTTTYNTLVADTLYKVVRRDAIKDTIASTYDGNGSADFENTVYYYNSNSDATKSNVLFNGICWQMVRTTDTGGVKLLYNGEADENDECGTGRPNHKGYGSKGSSNLTTSYKYGSSYTLSNGTFTLNDLYTYDGTNKTDLIGKYTCRNANTSCTTLYYIEQYNSENSFVQVPINSNTVHSAVGSTVYNPSSSSPAYEGYMYNTVYSAKSPTTTRETMSTQNVALNTTRYYDESVEWNSPEINKYNMTNPYTASSSDDYPSLVGKYAVSNSTNGASITTQYGTYAFYIVSVSGSTAYTIRLTNNESIADFEKYYTFGKNIVDNENGTFTVSNGEDSAITVKRTEWNTGRTNVAQGDYVCFGQSDTCSDVYQITGVAVNYFDYRQIGTYVYGNDVTYNENNPEGEKYELTGDKKTFVDWKSNYNKINNTHYTCFNSTGKCDEVYYIIYTYNRFPRYITLTNGKTVEDALEDMLSADNVNEKNSNIKSVVDLWYRENMINKTNYLEDTVYCNDRRTRVLGSYSKTGNTADAIAFQESSVTSDLTCARNVDSFTVSSENGNGALTYPTGLLSSPEANLLGKTARTSGSDYWLMSPNSWRDDGINWIGVRYVNGSGLIYNYYCNITNNRTVRPVISLKPNTEYTEGNGTYTKPYIIE